MMFSVLIANYNNGCFVREAINSVLMQTFTDWEIVIVDDASTDESWNIYKEFSDNEKISITYNTQRMGVGYTKRRCIELSKGEICGFLDADDRLAPEALYKMVEVHKAKPDCSLIYSTLYRLSSTGIEKGWDYLGAIEESQDLLLSRDKMVSHFATFKKSFYEKTVGIDMDLFSAEDRDLYLKLEEVGALFFVDEPLYYYRVDNQNSVSRGSSDRCRLAQYYYAISNLRAIKRRVIKHSILYKRNVRGYNRAFFQELNRLQKNSDNGFCFAEFKHLVFFVSKMLRSTSSVKQLFKYLLYKNEK